MGRGDEKALRSRPQPT
jgi:hypothetical protein